MTTINLTGTSGNVVHHRRRSRRPGGRLDQSRGGGLLTSDTTALETIKGGTGNSFYDLSSLTLAGIQAFKGAESYDGGHGTRGNSEIAFNNFVVANASATSVGTDRQHLEYPGARRHRRPHPEMAPPPTIRAASSTWPTSPDWTRSTPITICCRDRSAICSSEGRLRAPGPSPTFRLGYPRRRAGRLSTAPAARHRRQHRQCPGRQSDHRRRLHSVRHQYDGRGRRHVTAPVEHGYTDFATTDWRLADQPLFRRLHDRPWL